MAIEIRLAVHEDDTALAAIDQETWTAEVTPAGKPDAARPFFDESTNPRDVVVVLVDGVVAGYAKLGRATPVAASDHVAMITGLAVARSFQRRGVGRAVLDAVVEEARARRCRRVTLRVLGHNAGARRLYEAAGFAVEGILRGEFFLDGVYVDDVLMALELQSADPA